VSTEIRDFLMNNKLGALMVPSSLSRLAFNGEHYAPGRFRKRPGLTTAVTINLTVGTTAPFRMVTWKAANGTVYRVAVGADACGFNDPVSNLFFRRTGASTYSILSDAEPTPTVYRAAWGLSAPTGGTVTIAKNGQDDVPSSHAAGFYAYAVRARDGTTGTVSKPTWYAYTKITGISPETDKLQLIRGPLESTSIPGSGGELFRSRMLTFRSLSSWMPSPSGDFAHMRMIDTHSGTEYTDSGGQPDGPLLDFCDDIPPFGKAAAFFDGCWLYGAIPSNPYVFAISNPACPDNYPGNARSVLMEGPNGELLHAIGLVAVPTRAGPIVGFAVMGDSALVLCEQGAWPIIRGNQPGIYGISHDCLYVGCVSQATIAYSPVGVWWLSTEGVVLWTGQGAPEVITEQYIDPLHADTLFASDLSTACAAYDVPRKTFLCVVPKSGGGQFILAVRGDRLPNQIAISKWAQLTGLGDVIGMGYDWSARRVVFLFTLGAIVGRTLRTDGIYCDRTGSAGEIAAGTYAFGPTFLWGANEKVTANSPMVKRSVGMMVTALREDVSAAQTVVATVRGVYGPDDTKGTDVVLSPAVIFPLGSYSPVAATSTEAAGRLFRISLIETSTLPFEFSAVAIGSASEIQQLQPIG
jgi:hypothetical protein